MSVRTFEPAAPSEADAVSARDSAQRLAAKIAKANGALRLRVEELDGSGETVTIPTGALRLLVQVLTEMAAGNAVRLIADHAELTTQEAAELLNVSRPFVVKLLDDREIPSRLVGKHRRVLFSDVMIYRDAHFRARSAVLDRMAAIDQELGLA